MRLKSIAVGVGLVRITDGAEQFGGRGYGQVVQVNGYYRAKDYGRESTTCQYCISVDGEGGDSMIASKTIREAGSVKLTVDREILTH